MTFERKGGLAADEWQDFPSRAARSFFFILFHGVHAGNRLGARTAKSSKGDGSVDRCSGSEGERWRGKKTERDG